MMYKNDGDDEANVIMFDCESLDAAMTFCWLTSFILIKKQYST